MRTTLGRMWLIPFAVMLAIGGGVMLGACGEDSGSSGKTEQVDESQAADEARAARQERARERRQRSRERRLRAREREIERRERRLRREARERREQQQAEPTPAPEPEPAGDCEPGYDPCVPPYSQGDVDCADVNGPISVSGSDPHGLDADGDGTGCE